MDPPRGGYRVVSSTVFLHRRCQRRQFRIIDPCGLLVLALDRLVHLFAMHRDMRRRLDADPNFVSPDIDAIPGPLVLILAMTILLD